MNYSDSEEEVSLVAADAWKTNVIDIPDLVNLIADFCEDDTLSKLSRVIDLNYQCIHR